MFTNLGVLSNRLGIALALASSVIGCGGTEGGGQLHSEAPVTSDLYQGCYTDQSTRALPTQLMSSGATVETCIAAAQAKGFKYAGLQYGRECWAGDALAYAKVADSECNMACAAAASETCGGSWHNSIPPSCVRRS